jgi:hypothetical protein
MQIPVTLNPSHICENYFSIFLEKENNSGIQTFLFSYPRCNFFSTLYAKLLVYNSNVLTFGSPVANPKSGPDYYVFITIYFFNFIYPVRCLGVPPSPGLRTHSEPYVCL